MMLFRGTYWLPRTCCILLNILFVSLYLFVLRSLLKAGLLGKKSYVVINAAEFSYANETLSCRLCFAQVLRKICLI